ncbi:MAG: hypothetical protein IH861_02665 [Chloroflexi bacterium]|nr:hypothetical protein [Chloroflexota bacterium]
MTGRRQQMSFPVVESSKTILDFAVTSGRPPEEVLRQLESYGIEWYVTDQGDLLIRSWQVAAEDFVLAKRVAKVRQGQTIPDDADALEWVSANLGQLTREYAGNWIAVSDNAVAAASITLQELLSLIQAQSIQNPLITRVPETPIIWETAYANKDL